MNNNNKEILIGKNINSSFKLKYWTTIMIVKSLFIFYLL